MTSSNDKKSSKKGNSARGGGGGGRSASIGKHRERGRRERKRDQSGAGCPTPMKTPLPDAGACVAAINRGGNSGKGWGCYECVCGWWHLTSIPGRLFREFDPAIYRNDSYEYTPYEQATYAADKERWHADRKERRAGGDPAA